MKVLNCSRDILRFPLTAREPLRETLYGVSLKPPTKRNLRLFPVHQHHNVRLLTFNFKLFPIISKHQINYHLKLLPQCLPHGPLFFPNCL